MEKFDFFNRKFDEICAMAPTRKNRIETTESTRMQLLSAAQTAFSEAGLKGARIDAIAQRAGVNKQLVYHYFGSKDGLYSAVLEKVYTEIRESETKLRLEAFPAEEAMRRLIVFSYDYLADNPDFVRLLADENAHGGRHLNASDTVIDLNTPIIELIAETLDRGVQEGIFRIGLDPLHLYLSIAGMSFFYFANIHTISRIFGRNFDAPEAREERRAHIVDFVMNAIRLRTIPANLS
ncbi:transcriptional regulator, TetR family [Salinihabitans flavidus]|uniref:Transcriptional regulator, TetR family n=1 Tax=Salinihabitans flavidus TaxID=569882 RepID=A0A1H8MC60_9RHOB|nr:TetR family transcriptional regulator [Salinihabitans flavidus]SEO14808.1 transcriptional regulator, TetR family [Salinihabitans flavidus]